jgi:hypothetical protein
MHGKDWPVKLDGAGFGAGKEGVQLMLKQKEKTG